MSFETLSLEKNLSTPSYSSRLSSVTALNSSRSLLIVVAVIVMEDQRVAAAFADLLGDIPDDHIAAPVN